MARSAYCLVRHALAGAILAAGLALAPSAGAQVPPTASEIAAYQGLHAAAARGDTAALQRLLAGRPDVNARDAHGRTPLHVATFARQREAVRLLAQAGAALNLLENDRYDAVTIASVADEVRFRGVPAIPGAHLMLALAGGAHKA